MKPPPPDPSCACGHPRASHHRTDTGNITYCTVWPLTIPGMDPAKVATLPPRQCPCKTYTPQKG